MIPILGPILGIADKVLDRVIPDPEQRAAAKREMLKLQQEGHLQEAEVQLSAIIAEANSSDPWTSRARPSFLYVIYILLLSAIPFGALHAFSPEVASNVSAGVASWFSAIPDSLYQLFGIGYLGYSGARTIDKWRGNGFHR
jgi:hypothetical protein